MSCSACSRREGLMEVCSEEEAWRPGRASSEDLTGATWAAEERLKASAGPTSQYKFALCSTAACDESYRSVISGE